MVAECETVLTDTQKKLLLDRRAAAPKPGPRAVGRFRPGQEGRVESGDSNKETAAPK
jgi:hypothetical protein